MPRVLCLTPAASCCDSQRASCVPGVLTSPSVFVPHDYNSTLVNPGRAFRSSKTRFASLQDTKGHYRTLTLGLS
ncbi:hypothetical protein BT93_H0330 [Corymbia citriodora subsp. variegata]|nr:hypothetical protein BT93_H0330 [Corymbia citriodora subsp. variegata]